jgi:hypothetical protein
MVVKMKEETKEEALATHGAYVVLSDGSTYDGTQGVVVCYVTEIGLEQLEVNLDMKFVEDCEIASIPIEDLMDAYNQVHGTNL